MVMVFLSVKKAGKASKEFQTQKNQVCKKVKHKNYKKKGTSQIYFIKHNINIESSKNQFLGFLDKQLPYFNCFFN